MVGALSLDLPGEEGLREEQITAQQGQRTTAGLVSFPPLQPDQAHGVSLDIPRNKI